MRIPLLLVANPRTVKSGPTVRLSMGNWKIVKEGFKETIIAIASIAPTLSDLIVGPCDVQCTIITPGREQTISVFMELQDA